MTGEQGRPTIRDLKIGKGPFFRNLPFRTRIKIWWRERKAKKTGELICCICGDTIDPRDPQLDCPNKCWARAWKEEKEFLASANDWADDMNVAYPGLNLPKFDLQDLEDIEDIKETK